MHDVARLRAVALCLAGVLVANCGSAADVADRRVRSWAASARMVADAWLAGQVPQAYAVDALRTAQRELTSPLADLREAAARGRAPMARVDDAQRVALRITALGAAVERRDRDEVARTVAELPR